VSRRVRIGLIVLALVLVCVGLAVLSYALAPGQVLREQATLAPTLFVPPQGVP
jgi:hypothetical protein